MQLIIDSKYRSIFKNFLYRHKVSNVSRYMDALNNKSIKIFGSINKKEISVIIIVNLINNNYYIEDIIYDDNFIEVGNTLRYAIDFMRQEQLGISIIYDNYPYSLDTSSILLSCSFHCQNIEYTYKIQTKTSLIKRNLELNLKDNEVKKYILRKHKEIYNDELVLNIDNTNTLVSKEDKITGVLRFSLINNAINIHDIYADAVDIYIDLINMMKNLTSKTIIINVIPSRRDLIEALNTLKFEITNSFFKIDLQ